MITMGCMCYIEYKEHYLMLKRTKKENDIHKDFTISVGGKLEKGETPEECITREVKEETNLTINNPVLRGIITFPDFDGINDWYTYVFTATDFNGELIKDCPEGDLIWIKKEDILKKKIHTWEGDYIFLKWLIEEKAFFSAKFNYKNKKLTDYSVKFY